MKTVETYVLGLNALARALRVPLDTVTSAYARGQIEASSETHAGAETFDVQAARRALAQRPNPGGATKAPCFVDMEKLTELTRRAAARSAGRSLTPAPHRR